jgi:hypothetical protein
MARVTKEVITSDLSGKELTESEAAHVVISFDDKAKRYTYELDVAQSEVPKTWLKDAYKKAMRGRAPGRTASTDGRKPGSRKAASGQTKKASAGTPKRSDTQATLLPYRRTPNP